MPNATPQDLVDAVAAALMSADLRDPGAVAALASRFDTLAAELANQAEDQAHIDVALRCAAQLRAAAGQTADIQNQRAVLEQVGAETEKLQQSLADANARMQSLPPVRRPPVGGSEPSLL